MTYVDGVPVTPGYRGGGRVSSAGTEINVGTNSLEEASVTTGSSSAEFGNAQSGVISIQTRTGGSKFTGTLGYETDEPFGVNHSLGFNRFTGSLGGPIMRNLTFFVSAALEGQSTVESGKDSQNFPLFVQAGIDTTVAVPTALGDPTADTTMVAVYNYAVSPGRVQRFREQHQPRHRQQLRRRLPGHPGPVLGSLDLSAQRQAELLLRHRITAGLHRSHQPVPGPHLPGKSGRRPAGS